MSEIATAHPPAEHHASHEGEHHHVAGAQTFIGTLVALLILTILTVVVSRFDFGQFNMLIAMAIAAIKASLVISIFMQLKWDTPINQIVFLGSFLFVALLFLFTLADLATRGQANSMHKIPAPLGKEAEWEIWVHPSKRPGGN